MELPHKVGELTQTLRQLLVTAPGSYHGGDWVLVRTLANDIHICTMVAESKCLAQRHETAHEHQVSANW